MEKNFSPWNSIKADVHEQDMPKFFDEREIWFAQLGTNIGFEQDGKGTEFLRPVIIIKKFNPNLCWIIPLTSTYKDSTYYFSFISTENIRSSAILSQIRLIDSKRLKYKKGKIQSEDFLIIKKRLGEILEIL